MSETTDRIDYRALRQQVKERRHSRRTVRKEICLDASLYDQWLRLTAIRQTELTQSIGRDPNQPDPTARHGDLDTQAKIEALEERIAAASVVAVFVVPDPEKQAAWNARFQELRDAGDAQALHAHGVVESREVIAYTFDRFEDADGQPIPAEQFGATDLEDLLKDWPQGQLFGLAAEIKAAGAEVPDLPLSVRRSLTRRR